MENLTHLKVRSLNLKTYILDPVYLLLREELGRKRSDVARLFGEYVGGKIRGYSGEHPWGLVPFGEFDLFSTLFITGTYTVEGFEPLMVVKVSSLSSARQFGKKFEQLGLASLGEKNDHLLSVERAIESADHDGVDLCYLSSWTIAKSVRVDPILSDYFKRAPWALFQKYFLPHSKFRLAACAVERFKVDQLLKQVGFDYMTDSTGAQLEKFPLASLDNEKIRFMLMREFSERYAAYASPASDLWKGVELIRANAFQPGIEKKSA